MKIKIMGDRLKFQPTKIRSTFLPTKYHTAGPVIPDPIE